MLQQTYNNFSLIVTSKLLINKKKLKNIFLTINIDHFLVNNPNKSNENMIIEIKIIHFVFPRFPQM